MKTDYEKDLDFQEEKMRKYGKIQEEMQLLNKHLDKCIDLVASSIMNADLRSQFEQMKNENKKSLSASNDALEFEMANIKKSISDIREKMKKESNEESNHS